MNKTLLPFVLSFAALVIIAGFAIHSYRHPFVTKDTVPAETTLYRAVLSGEYVCLPHVNQNGPQTLECALGMKTDSGDYYSIDFNSSPELQLTLVNGDHFKAGGTVTKKEALNSDGWQKYPIVGIFTITDSFVKLPKESGGYECNQDGKICPDGSVVGRTGNDCHFTECPSPDATAASVTANIGQTATALTVSITPKEVVSDSRCPSDVQCVWAGTVEVRAVTATKVAHGEQVFKFGEPKTFGEYTITLTGVMPESKKSGEVIPPSSYRFIFQVKKK